MLAVGVGYVIGFAALFVCFTRWLEKRLRRSAAMAVAIIASVIFTSVAAESLFQLISLIADMGKQS